MSEIRAESRQEAAKIIREARASGFAVRVVRRGYEWLLNGGAGGVFRMLV